MMFGLFKKKKAGKKEIFQLADRNGSPLSEGDLVMSFRYDLGKCIIKNSSNGFEYESLESKKTVNWTLMIDAANERQKVEKIE